MKASFNPKAHAVTIVFDDGTAETRTGGSHSWRNNNPGNMEFGPFAQHHGAIGTDGRFAIYPDEATGHVAILALLALPGYQALTVGDAIAKWAPPSENDTATYAAFVAHAVGAPSTTKMAALSPSQVAAVAQAIRLQEGWRAGIVTRQRQGIGNA